MLPKTRALLKELPADGSQQLLQLWKQINVPRTSAVGELSPVEQLRLLLIRLSENWELYTLFSWEADVPWTSNVTEQVIGRMKMRYRTVRGYKSRDGLLLPCCYLDLGSPSRVVASQGGLYFSVFSTFIPSLGSFFPVFRFSPTVYVTKTRFRTLVSVIVLCYSIIISLIFQISC